MHKTRTKKHPCFSFSTTALCIGILRDLGVTAVLNAAQGTMSEWNYVNTRESYYRWVILVR